MTSLVRVSTEEGAVLVDPGDVLSCGVKVRAASTARNARVGLAFYKADHSFISRVQSSYASATSSAWLALTLSSQIAPALSASVCLEVDLDANVGEQFYVDLAYIAAGDDPLFDPGGFGGVASFVVRRSFDGGVTWEYVRGAGPGDGLGEDAGLAVLSASVVDREARLRDEVLYSAYVSGGTTDVVVSAEAVTDATRILATSWWLRDPLDPTRDVAISQQSLDVTEGPGYSGTAYDAEGRGESIVLFSDLPGSASFDLDLWALDKATFDAVMLLLRSKRTLVVQTLHGQRWYVRTVGDPTYTQLRAIRQGSEFYPVRHSYNVKCAVREVEAP